MSKSVLFFVAVGAFALALIALVALAPFGDYGETARPLALEDAGADAVTFELREVDDSGSFGFATLDPLGGRTRIGLEIGSPSGLPQPAHVHRGSCGRFDREPVYALEPLTTTSPRLATSTTIVDAALEDLSGLVIDVHQSERDPHVYVACGEVPGGE